ncbi:orotidine-5'-phosphate decarboxylase [Terriglobus sp. RCC_193]|uniref:orotidine-5'-phosphate decarboxylase n=1 Tax=Terriglobus sp. RCC_193 TaxID=3239218 RepID=UPI0035236AFB
MNPADHLIVALDVPNRAQALDMVERLEGNIRWFKVGLELYLAEGRPIVEAIRERGFEVFLDLKLHDIPNTVAGAVRTASASGASLLTLHAVGGPVMLAAAREAAEGLAQKPRLLAVTVLTSMDATQLHATGIAATPAEQVIRLAEMATDAGIAGLVCSPEEVVSLRSSRAKEALLVVPGIRPASSVKDDQNRIATPADAIRRGANMLVVGRPITGAADPAGAAAAILHEIAAAKA